MVEEFGKLVDIIAHFIAIVGFPAFIACWLLLRHEQILIELTQAIQKLERMIALCHGKEADHENC